MNKVLKQLTSLITLGLVIFASTSQARGVDHTDYDGLDNREVAEIRSFLSHTVGDILRENKTLSSELEAGNVYDPISDYETWLPHESQIEIPRLESALLTAYLNDPSSTVLSKAMAAYHVVKLPKWRATLYGRDRKSVRSVKHAVYALYFLRRAQHLGSEEAWLTRAETQISDQLLLWLPTDLPIDISEGHDAHTYFLESFNYKEVNRYLATEKLLQDLLDNPTNLTTNAYAIASNIWNGGEADYDDPTILYSMVMSSYLAQRAIPLYQLAEQAWEADPENNQQFRLTTLLGGWTVPARLWLAKLHGDNDTVELLDAEHREWFAINPYFHSASIGWMLFDDPQKVMEGFQSVLSVMGCADNRSCMDRPRFSFNILSYLLLVTDYSLKLGDAGTASYVLSFRHNPFFEYDSWLLGQEAWEHRENNMMEIIARYQNDDINDDPTTASLKSHKWGPNTITCQLCHQAQAREWSDEDKATIFYPSEAHGYVGNWPTRLVDWDALLAE